MFCLPNELKEKFLKAAVSYMSLKEQRKLIQDNNEQEIKQKMLDFHVERHFGLLKVFCNLKTDFLFGTNKTAYEVAIYFRRIADHAEKARMLKTVEDAQTVSDLSPETQVAIANNLKNRLGIE